MNHFFIKTRISSLIIFFVISVGVLCILLRFFRHPGVWLDEAYIILAIIKWHPFCRESLIYNQNAGYLFLLLEKLILSFTLNDYYLRLPLVLSGILSIFIFYRYLRLEYSSYNYLIVLGLVAFCFNRRLFFYSLQIKPYVIDILGGTLYLYLISLKNFNWKIGIFFFLFFPLLSIPSIFLITGIFIFYLYENPRDIKKILVSSFSIIIWIIHYLSFLKYQNIETLKTYWRSAFLSWESIPKTLYRISEYPLNDSLFGLSIIIFLLGLYVIINDSKKRIPLIFPILATAIASFFSFYPFKGRLIVFLLPLIITIYIKGLYHIYAFLSSFEKVKKVVIFFFTIFLIKTPFGIITKELFYPRISDSNKVIREFFSNYNHEAVFVMPRAYPIVKYYTLFWKKDIKIIRINNLTFLEKYSPKDSYWIIFHHSFDRKFIERYFSSRINKIIDGNNTLILKISP